MTHTLHRHGTCKTLVDDYVMLAMSGKGHNEEGSTEKLREFLPSTLQHKPVNMGNMKTRNMLEMGARQIVERVRDTSIVHAVFCDKETVLEC